MTDPLIDAARFLLTQLDYVRHQPWVDEFAQDVGDCAGRLRSLVNGPAEQRFLGPCGALVQGPRCDSEYEPQPCGVCEVCPGDVYAYRGASAGRCRLCETEWSTSDRQAWLDGEVRAHAFRTTHIADAYGVRAGTIRVWAHRGQLKSYWRTEAGIVADWPPPEGEDHDRLHYVGDVLDLAAADAARRAENQAKRARRAATEEAAVTGP